MTAQLTGVSGAQVLRDGEVSKSTRAARAQGLKLMGQLFCDAAEVATLKQAGQVSTDNRVCFVLLLSFPLSPSLFPYRLLLSVMGRAC